MNVVRLLDVVLERTRRRETLLHLATQGDPLAQRRMDCFLFRTAWLKQAPPAIKAPMDEVGLSIFGFAAALGMGS